jgi:hypothetical protein
VERSLGKNNRTSPKRIWSRGDKLDSRLSAKSPDRAVRSIESSASRIAETTYIPRTPLLLHICASSVGIPIVADPEYCFFCPRLHSNLRHTVLSKFRHQPIPIAVSSCVFTAIVIFAIAGHALVQIVRQWLVYPTILVLLFVENLILLADALWFTVSLTEEIADWLENSGVTAPQKGGKPAAIIVIILCIVAVGGILFGKEAGETFNSVHTVIAQ